VGAGDGDGLWLHDCDCSSVWGTLLNTVKVARCCCCCAVGLGVTSCRRHCWTSLRSASLSFLWCGLDMPLPPSQEDLGDPRLLPREAPTKGMGKRRLEAPLLPLRDSPSEGERGPQWTPQEKGQTRAAWYHHVV
jgi:hypothetical protein